MRASKGDELRSHERGGSAAANTNPADLAESDAIDAAEDAKYGPDRRGDELPQELAQRQARLKKIQEAKAALEEEARATHDAKGKARVLRSPRHSATLPIRRAGSW
jgi:hypothetical protein